MQNIQNEDCGFEHFEKGQILRPFSGLAPSKMIKNMHIEFIPPHLRPYGIDKSVVLRG